MKIIETPPCSRVAGFLSLVLAVAAATMAFSLPSRAQAAIYWANGSDVGRANLDGSLLEPKFIAQVPPGEGESTACADVVVTGSQIFWSNPGAGTIGRADLDGSNANHAFITGASNPCRLAVNGTHLFWVNQRSGSIGRANLDGTGADQTFVEGLAEPCGVAASDSFLYWSSSVTDQIERASLLSGDVQSLIKGHDHGIEHICGIAIGGAHIYWSGFFQDIGRAALDGSSPEPEFLTGVGNPRDIAVDGSHLYWSEGWSSGAIGSARLDGTATNPSVLAGLNSPTGIAVDSTTLHPPLEQSRAIVFGDALYKKKKGIALVSVYTPAAGDLRVETAGVSWQIIPRPMPADLSSGSLSWIRIRPGAGDEGDRLRRQLKRKGRASLELRVSYQEPGKASIAAGKRITLIRKANKKKPTRHRKKNAQLSAAGQIRR